MYLADQGKQYGNLLLRCGGVKRREALLYPSVVDAQKLVLRGCHVHIVGLAFSTFFVKKLVHGLVRRRFSQVDRNNLKQRFPQMR